jgi:sugar lactone lactonase YvrE
MNVRILSVAGRTLHARQRRSPRPVFRFAIVMAVFWAGLDHPPRLLAALGFLPGDILVMDSNASAGNGLLFRVNRETGEATRFGNGFGLEPWTLAAPTPSVIYAADVTGNTVSSLNVATGGWSTVSSEGLLDYPSGAMVVESSNSVLVASGGGRVVRVNTNTGQQSVFADYSSLGADPWGMTRAADGNLYITDLFNGRIIRIAPNGTSSVASSGGLLRSTLGIAALPDGSLAVGDLNSMGQGSIVRVNPVTGAQSYITPPGSFPWYLNSLAVDIDGFLLVAASHPTGRGSLHRVRLGDGQVTPWSSDADLANPAGIAVVAGDPSQVATLVARDADWKYRDDGANLGTAWRFATFSDAAWSSGPGELGYGDADEATVVNCGPRRPTCDAQNFATTYFRHQFQVSQASLVTSLSATLVRDDAAAVFLNGVEVFRDANLPAGATSTFYSTSSNGEDALVEFLIDTNLLVSGANLLAVEVHQSAHDSSDVSFSLTLRGAVHPIPEPATLWLVLPTGIALALRRYRRF